MFNVRARSYRGNGQSLICSGRPRTRYTAPESDAQNHSASRQNSASLSGPNQAQPSIGDHGGLVVEAERPKNLATDVASSSRILSAMPKPKEAPEVEALCMAQRARTPVALAIAGDWSESPFRVPRKFIVLGWFWIADAWVSLYDIFLPMCRWLMSG